EVVHLVARVRERERAEHPTVARRGWIDVHHANLVGPVVAAIVERGHVCDALRRRIHRHAGRRVKGGIGSPQSHLPPPCNCARIGRTPARRASRTSPCTAIQSSAPPFQGGLNIREQRKRSHALPVLHLLPCLTHRGHRRRFSRDNCRPW